MRTFDHRHGRHIEVEGVRIYAESTGADPGTEAPVIVLLHGGFGNMEDFNGLLPALDGWRVIGIDSRGHGASTLGDQPWTYQRVQEDVESVLEALGVRQCTLLGFSDGGTVALRVGAAGRLAIERIVVIGATWHNKNVEATRGILQKVKPAGWRRKFPETYDAYQRLNPKPDFARFTEALKRGWLDEGASGHPGDHVARIRVPVLIVRGDDDHLTALADAMELRDKLPDAHLLNIPSAGHVAYAEGKAVFVPALRAFLAEGTIAASA